MILHDAMQAEREGVQAALARMIGRPEGVAPAEARDHLRTMLETALGSGGKRLRALLPPAMVRAAEGPVAAAHQLGAAIELVHNGTLVHDDIQDGDELRRGQPTLWRLHGQAQAINAGNALLVTPLTALAAAGDLGSAGSLPADTGARLAAMLGQALCETIAGQVGDLDAHGNRTDLRRLESVAMAKTAPLFGVAIEGTGLLLGRHRREAAQRAAQALGLAFQLRDDLLDLLGTKGRGAAGSDLREGKPTMPMLLALQDAPPSVAQPVFAAITQAAQGHQPSEEVIAEALHTVLQLGAVERGRRRLLALIEDAHDAADEALPAAPAALLRAFADRLVQLDG